MCFYHEGDWVARYVEDETETLTERQRCSDCHQMMNAGETCRRLYLQERDYCPECGQEYPPECESCPDGDGSPCRWGETATEYVCVRCTLLRAAVREVEEAEGCTGQEAEPPISELREAFWESDHAQEYLDRARADYPELAFSGHLDQFYQLTHEWDELMEEQWDAEDLEPVEELGGES